MQSHYWDDCHTEASTRAGLIQCEELSERLYALFWQEGATAPAG